MKYKRIWAVTANGGRARIIKNLGSETTDEELIEFASNIEKLGQIMSDRAGRSFASAGSGRSSMELKSDPVRDNEKQFAAQITEYLSDYHQKGEFSALIVAASPRTLGDFRRIFSDSLQKAVVRESDKDFTLMPVKKLKAAFQQMLRPQEFTS